MSKRNLEKLLEEVEYVANTCKCNSYINPSDKKVLIDNYNIVTAIIPELFTKTDARLCDIMHNDIQKLLIDAPAQVFIENNNALSVLKEDSEKINGTIIPSKCGKNGYEEGKVIIFTDKYEKVYTVGKEYISLKTTINDRTYLKIVSVDKKSLDDNLDLYVSLYEVYGDNSDLMFELRGDSETSKTVDYISKHVLGEEVKLAFPELYEEPSFVKTR